MKTCEINQITNLFDVDLSQLLKESKQEGFRFIERLVDDYESAVNTFSLPGECLFGIFHEEDKLVAIGGLNTDPYSEEDNVGRLRRFYVSREFRRSGLGRLLVRRILKEAEKHY
ncbi:GNAT family N-acetyltransferase [Rossellomorea aquimaris]|uniref:GNAT family N-acetyltransferase n=1 Tax=Rossellomorea aquimaris TaxID=189382 RepID=UPI003990AC72